MGAYTSLYQTAEWSEKDSEEVVEAVREHSKNFNAKLYDVVTDDIESDNMQEELQRKYGPKMSELDAEDFRFSATHEHPSNYPYGHGKMEDPLIMLMKIEPHALDLLVRPRIFVPGTMVRLMY